MTRAEVTALLLELLDSSLRDAGVARDSVSDDTDLREVGVMDSLRFVQLIGELESRLGATIDLADLDPATLTRLGPLCSHIAAMVVTR
jgi:acyl carrier protein